MSHAFLLTLVMRWLHVFAAIVAVGGAIFMRFVLMPVAGRVLPDDAHNALRSALTTRWQRFVHACILAFLISGLYNYLAVTRFEHQDQPLYHMLFGVKALLALGVFALALALTSLRPWSAAMRARGPFWLGILVATAAAVVLVSGFLKTMPKTAGPSVERVQVVSTFR